MHPLNNQLTQWYSASRVSFDLPRQIGKRNEGDSASGFEILFVYLVIKSGMYRFREGQRVLTRNYQMKLFTKCL